MAGSSALLPQTGERVAPLADLHLLLACAVFFAVGGPVRWLLALRQSFEVLPVTAYPAGELLEQAVIWALDGSAAALRTAIGLAMPAAGAALAADCLLGFVQRVAPGLPVHFVGQPLRSALVLAWVGLTLAAGWEEVIRGWTG